MDLKKYDTYDGEIQDYYDDIKDKIQRVLKYEKVKNKYNLLFLLSIFGLLPTGITIIIIQYIFRVELHIIFLFLFWFIFGVIYNLPIRHYTKKINKIPYEKYEKLFYLTYTAYNFAKKYSEQKVLEDSIEASKLLSQDELLNLNYKFNIAFDIPAIDKDTLVLVSDLFKSIEKTVIPRLKQGKDIEKILPIIKSLPILFHLEKNFSSSKIPDYGIQDEFLIDVNNYIGDLKLKPLTVKKVNVESFLDKTYLSEYFIIRALLFSISIASILSFIAYLLYLYGFLDMSTDTGKQTIMYFIGMIITVSLLGGIQLARYCKKGKINIVHKSYISNHKR